MEVVGHIVFEMIEAILLALEATPAFVLAPTVRSARANVIALLAVLKFPQVQRGLISKILSNESALSRLTWRRG